MFYMLSLLTGVLECGWITFGVAHSCPLWQILCYPLAYHIGNLFPKPFSLNCSMLRIMCSLSFGVGILTFSVKLPERVVFALTCLALFTLSTIIQSVRSGMKSDGNRLFKRLFRVGGFALAPLAAVVPSAILVFASIAAFLALHKYEGKLGITHMTWQNGFSLVMIFHQLHYFFYAHITLAAMSQLLLHDSASGIEYAAILFCGTWITYMSVEPVISRMTDTLLPVFYAGHIGIGILLFVMYHITSVILFTVLWIVSGFGGGVVYTIPAKAKAKDSYQKDSMTIAENISHTLGLLTAVGVAVIFSETSPQIMLMLGSASAFLAVVSMMLISIKEHYHENIHSEG